MIRHPLTVRTILNSLREAWWTFRMGLSGWRVREYSLPARPDSARVSGHISFSSFAGGWRINTRGASGSVYYSDPLQAAQGDEKDPMTQVLKSSHARAQNES